MFDQEKFSKIIIAIKDYHGSLLDFAKAAGIGRSYLSKYKNKRLLAPPTPKVLEKISMVSNGLTNYDELMQVCGYLNNSSKDILAQNTFREYEPKIDSLHIPNLDKDFLFELLTKQDEQNGTVLTKISKFIEANYGVSNKSKELFDIITQIDADIKNIVINQTNTGVPLYSISKIPMYKVGYFPSDNTKNHIAVVANNDKMLPLIGTGDIAVIYLQKDIIDGQTVLLVVDNSYYDIAKIYSEANICKLYFMNSKSEELDLSRIQIIGEVIFCQNKSAFKKGGI